MELDTFYIGKYPVTQGLWKAVMGEGNNPSFFKGDLRPIESVSWNQIVFQFLPRLNQQICDTMPIDYSFRLPTEAEWEYANQGGLVSIGFKYAGSDQLKNVGWYKGNSHSETKDVGQKQSNELGLCDMGGNVREWCWDWFNAGYFETCQKKGKVKNPPGPERGTYRVYRGGSWFHYADYCRSAYRAYWQPWVYYNYVGFRLVLSPQSVGAFPAWGLSEL
ncbi:MAG: formylglycine-generating enzyme family protein [Saprospiraceae bacterium]